MISKKLVRAFVLAVVSVLVSSCAQFDAAIESAVYNTIGKPLEYLEDSIRGYRVDYVTIPAGAELTCEGEDLGRTPLRKWYDLTDEQKKYKVFTPPDCLVRWESGAAAEVRVEVSLEQFPKRVYIVEERPQVYDGEDEDVLFGEKYLEYRQQQLQQAAVAFLSIASAVHSASKLSSASTSFGTSSPLDLPRFQSVKGTDGISWNWVSAGSEPNFGAGDNLNSLQHQRGLTPVSPASSCSGAIVMGKCAGAVINTGVQSFCAGKMINGRCVGSVVY